MKLTIGKKINTERLSYSGFIIPKGSTVRLAVYPNSNDDVMKIVSVELTEDLDIDNDYPMMGKILSVEDEE